MITNTSLGAGPQSTPARVAQQAKRVASTLGEKAEDATFAAGNRMKSFAAAIRDKGPQEGALGGLTTSVANNLESGGDYLQRKGVNGIAREVTNLIRRNPLPALLVGLGVGCVIARLTARS